MIKNKFTKLLACFLAIVSITTCFIGCGGDKANVKIPEGYQLLEISNSNGKTLRTVGTECDPHFLYCNVGRKLTTSSGEEREVLESDWDDIFVPRIKSMELGFMRVMILPSWYAMEEEYFRNKTYTWDSPKMKSLYQVLDTAQENNIEINLTMWLWDCNYMRKDVADNPDLVYGEGSWTICSQGEGDRVFAEVFADGVKYLRNVKGYTCIREITPVNEPDSTFSLNYSKVKAFEAYESLCRAIDTEFKEQGIRNDVLFILSDDARSQSWLSWTCENLSGIYDRVNSHSYDFGEGDTNDGMINNGTYSLGGYVQIAEEYNVEHVFNEFGTNTHNGDSNWTLPSRGLQISRVALNMLQAGSCGFSYWMLFSEYYDPEPDEANDALRSVMGLWGTAAENYDCRPVYYAYSMLTRLAKQGSKIYLINSNDENVVAVALEFNGKWSYLIVNDSETESKNVSFLNRNNYPSTVKKYVYDQNNVPSDNQVISATETISADGRVISDTILPLSFTVYSDIK